MNHPTLQRLGPALCALALVAALAQPVLVTPAHAATAPIVTDGKLKVVREAWNRFGPVIMTLVWELVTDWMTGQPPTPTQPVEPPQPDPDYTP